MKTAQEFQILATVSDYARHYGLPAPTHPLLLVIDLAAARDRAAAEAPLTAAGQARLLAPVVPQLYTIFLKRNLKGLLYYGHQPYDFSEGVLGFSAPGQVFRVAEGLDTSAVTGWMLVFHPDLLARYPLGQKMASYAFFGYDVREALHLAAREEAQLAELLQVLKTECEQPIDAFSQDVLVAQLETLLSYANRFYHRQFLTRRAAPHDLLSRFEARLTAYFAHAADQPLPTVQHFAEALYVSPAYLGELLRSLTGQSTQQHIHHALIERAKQLLLSTSLSVNETAFRLGFEYPQYFSRLFKSKTGHSPAAFRRVRG